MKQIARTFIKEFKSLKCPSNDKSELATRFLYSALIDRDNKEDLRFNTSAIKDINESNPIIKDVYEELLDQSIYFSKKEIKELNNECISKFRTGPYINSELYRLVVKLLNLKSSDILLQVNAQDESFVLEANNAKKEDRLKLSTLVIPDNDRASELIMMRSKLNDLNITLVDGIAKIKRFNPNKVFINPLYSTIDKDYKYSNKDNHFWEDIKVLMEIMPKNSKVIALVPNVMLSNSLDKEVKSTLLTNDYIEGIVSLPLRYYSKALNTEVSLLVLSKGNNEIKIVNILKIFTTADLKEVKLDSVTNYIVENYNFDFTKVNKKDLLNKESNLLISNIITENIYQNYHNPKPLIKIAEVKTGTKKTKIAFKDSIDQNGESSYCLLSSNDIEDGNIKYDDLTRIIYDSRFEKFIVKNGDVVLTNKSSKIKIAVIDCDDKKIIPLGKMIVISPHNGVLDGYYLKMFFESDDGQELIAKTKRGQRTNTINESDLKVLQIPYEDYENQLKITAKYKSKLLELSNKKAELKELEKEIKTLINKRR